MQEVPSPSWRDLLRQRLRQSGEKQRLARVLGVAPLTLTRWANGTVVPRPANLEQLIDACPDIAEELRRSIRQEFSSFGTRPQSPDNEKRIPSIPDTFYLEILELRAKTPRSIRFWSLCRRILAHAMATFDPSGRGLMALLSTCTLPRKGVPVQSLRVIMGEKTPSGKQDSQTIPFALLGAESLASYAIARGHVVTSQSFEDSSVHIGHERGLAICCPIESGNNIAGCFEVRSLLPSFSQPPYVELVAAYARLLALAFNEEAFYDPHDIRLAVMPPPEVQAAAFASFRDRVLQLLRDGQKQQQPLRMEQAEMVIWQQMEGELMQYMLRNHQQPNP